MARAICPGVHIFTPDGGAQQRPVGISSDPVRCDGGIGSRPATGSPPPSAAGPASGPEFASQHAYRAPGTTLRRGFRGTRSGADFARTVPLCRLLPQRSVRQRPQVTRAAAPRHRRRPEQQTYGPPKPSVCAPAPSGLPGICPCLLTSQYLRADSSAILRSAKFWYVCTVPAHPSS